VHAGPFGSVGDRDVAAAGYRDVPVPVPKGPACAGAARDARERAEAACDKRHRANAARDEHECADAVR